MSSFFHDDAFQFINTMLNVILARFSKTTRYYRKVYINHELIFHWRNLVFRYIFNVFFSGKVKAGFKDNPAPQSGVIFCQITPEDAETDKTISLDTT